MWLAPLVLAARHAKPLLIAGLVAGVLLPGLADAIASQLPLAAAGLLALAALRIGPRAALGLGRDLRLTLGAVAVLQMGTSKNCPDRAAGVESRGCSAGGA